MGNGLWKCSVSIAVCTDDSGELSDGISIRVPIFLYVQNKQDEICGYEDGSGNRHRSSHCSAVPSALFGTDGIDRL